MPVRVGLTPTPVMVRCDWGTSSPAASRKAAEEMSPGTAMSSGVRGRLGRSLVVTRPSTRIGAPMAASMRSVWSRAGPGWRTMARPSLYSPASSRADLTWALATGSV